MKQSITLEGNNFEVGRKLGKYWGDYFGNLDGRKGISHNYKEWLQKKSLTEDYVILLSNVVQRFPALYDELQGMTAGINESKIGIKATLLGLFSCWLAETDLSHDEYNGCSSVLLPLKDGYFLAHSDEYDKPYPLVVADVSLKSVGAVKRFTSISHPFQLLGSAVGHNEFFAFQANSIGCSKAVFNTLQKSWQNRIPKTVFTRCMLELSSIDEIKALYQEHRSTLPNHHYLVFPDGAYSVEVRPINQEQVNAEPLDPTKIHVHSNHFIDDDSNNWIWSSKTKENNLESIVRLKDLRSRMQKLGSSEQVRKAFMHFLEEYKQDGEILKEKTSGVFFFEITKSQGISCKAELFYES